MPLNNHSCYSFRYGVTYPKDLLSFGISKGYRFLALTDINNTSACLDFLRLAQDKELHPVVGVDFRNGIDQRFVGLAKSNRGYRELNSFLSQFLTQEHIEIPKEAPSFEDVFIIYPLNKIPRRPLYKHEYIGVCAHELNRLKVSKTLPKDRLVALQHGTFYNQEDYKKHKLLRAIDLNTIYTKVTTADYADKRDALLSRSTYESLFEYFPELIEKTDDLLSQCNVTFDFKRPSFKNQRTYTGSIDKDNQLLRRLCREKLVYRYAHPTKEILERLGKELSIIEQKEFVSYFLINWDITSYARSRGYFYVGRGSGANSIVAYLLQITDVDPIELDLYFERFINLYREIPPDFDIDFSWKDREDITQYIFSRFPNTALLATYNTFQYRGAVRELSKVFGLPKEEQDRLSSSKNVVWSRLDNLSKLVLKCASLIQGLPSHLSVHAAGIVISELPLHQYTATFIPPKGFPTTQFDMVVAEDIGLFKFDILGQRGLAKIKDSLAIIRKMHPTHDPIDIHDIKRFKEDSKIKELLKEGQAIGCFYVESPAMRMLLKKLKVDHYLGLVAASSIIRPGVAKSGMMREYILRERDPERRKRTHPVMAEIMPDTYGIMVYQEDVIKVAHYFAGLTLGEADVLRRGMSGKYRSRDEFQKIKNKYFENCKDKYPEELSKEIWRQIESFAGYAFAKGHSASYAVESYQSLFLKAYYPLEYMVATINNGGGFYRAELYIHEARMHGAEILAPCINSSDKGCILSGQQIYLGLGMIHGLESELIDIIIKTREKEGRFKSLIDFAERTCIGLEHLCTVIRINAFRCINISKKELLWKAHQLLRKQNKSKVIQKKLFKTTIKDYELPDLNNEEYEDAFDQFEILGFPICNPFSLLENQDYPRLTTKDLPQYLNKIVYIMGYLIHIKSTDTSRKEKMKFGTFLDIKGVFLDTVHFPETAHRYPFTGKGIYALKGKVVEEFGYYSLEALEMKRLPYIQDPRFREEAIDKEKLITDLT